jgi:hypothetical protein
MIQRGATLRRVRIIGPDGEFIMADMPLEAAAQEADERCASCGNLLHVSTKG